MADLFCIECQSYNCPHTMGLKPAIAFDWPKPKEPMTDLRERLEKACTHTFHRLGGIDDCPSCASVARLIRALERAEEALALASLDIGKAAACNVRFRAKIVECIDNARAEIARILSGEG